MQQAFLSIDVDAVFQYWVPPHHDRTTYVGQFPEVLAKC